VLNAMTTICDKLRLASAGLLLVLAVSGCSSYYSVTDPATKKVFYTPKVDRNKKLSAVTFVDARSGAMTVVTNGVVEKVKRDQFNKALW
jgi:hypothetical protein